MFNVWIERARQVKVGDTDVVNLNVHFLYHGKTFDDGILRPSIGLIVESLKIEKLFALEMWHLRFRPTEYANISELAAPTLKNVSSDVTISFEWYFYRFEQRPVAKVGFTEQAKYKWMIS